MLSTRLVLNRILEAKLIACVASSVGSPRTLPLRVAADVVRVSGTAVLVYNAPATERDLGRLLGVPWSFLELLELLEAEGAPAYGLLANTSGARSADEAIGAAFAGVESFRPLRRFAANDDAVIKLEVLDETRQPVDAEVLTALGSLVAEGLCVLPLVSPDAAMVRECFRAGAPMVRVLSGMIGQPTGIRDMRSVAEAINFAPGPVILEGGISSDNHVRSALGMGAAGVLVNGAFHRAADPVNLARDLRAAVRDTERVGVSG